MSMEVMYYLKNPIGIINTIVNKALNDNGILIVGIDHYKENKNSLSWPNDLKVEMSTLSIDQWVKIYKNCGLSNIYSTQYAVDNDLSGTLIIAGNK